MSTIKYAWADFGGKQSNRNSGKDELLKKEIEWIHKKQILDS